MFEKFRTARLYGGLYSAGVAHFVYIYVNIHYISYISFLRFTAKVIYFFGSRRSNGLEVVLKEVKNGRGRE